LSKRFDKICNDLQFGFARAKAHRSRHVRDDMHRHAGTLAMHAHQPVATDVAHARTQIQPARIGPLKLVAG